jgi:NAD(P)-dependent dehydrogenase (short-subunit alcohol dehydrogenase family)
MHCDCRHALVTGASSGIGRAIALTLARRGFHVYATVRRLNDGESLQRETAGQITPLLMDVTRQEQIAEAEATVRGHVGQRGLDALINNAGVGLFAPLELVSLTAFRTQFEINVDGQLAVTQAFLPLIRDATGRLIMIGSIGDRLTPPFFGPLSASKHALLALTEALRQELAPWKIRVVLIEPGNIRSEAGSKFKRDTAEMLGHFDANGRALYADAFRSMTSRFAAQNERGSQPQVVADLVGRVIDSQRPRARYTVGKDARFLAILGWLPSTLRDPILGRVFGLPRPGAQDERRETRRRRAVGDNAGDAAPPVGLRHT